jgi:uncharacterized protein with von Willebrand factor type A (vWA) domain
VQWFWDHTKQERKDRMNSETFNETQLSASEKLLDAMPEDFNRRVRRELAAETVRAEMAEMEAAGRVLQLTDEEIRLLRSFRRFKSTAKKAGEIFKWQTVPLTTDTLVIEPGQAVHITDPQDVSGR